MFQEITEESVKTLTSDDILSRLTDIVSILARCRTMHGDPTLKRYERDRSLLKQELSRRLELYDALVIKKGEIKMEANPLGRRFTIPNEYEPTTGVITGGDINCRHDYPEELKKIEDNNISWECARCGQVRTYKKINPA